MLAKSKMIAFRKYVLKMHNKTSVNKCSCYFGVILKEDEITYP